MNAPEHEPALVPQEVLTELIESIALESHPGRVTYTGGAGWLIKLLGIEVVAGEIARLEVVAELERALHECDDLRVEVESMMSNDVDGVLIALVILDRNRLN